MILVHKGTELVGEGTGLGVPAVRCGNRTYFSGSSKVQTLQSDKGVKVIKQFTLNIVPEKWFRKTRIENKAQRKLATNIAELYQKHRHLRQTFETLKLKKISRRIGLQTSFTTTKPVGNATVTYHVEQPFVNVEADFRSLRNVDLQRIYLFNEHGTKHFRKYLDSNGTVLFDEQIGAWEIVEADWACFSDGDEKIGFRLWKIEDAVLRRGREFLNDTLDWVGLDYEAGPDRTRFEYNIEVLGDVKQK